MNKTVEAVGGDLAGDLAALRQDVARLTETMSELVQDRTRAFGSRAAAAVGDARDRIASTAADAQSRARAVGGDIEAGVERHPLAAVLIAFGVGVAFGMLSRRHR